MWKKSDGSWGDKAERAFVKVNQWLIAGMMGLMFVLVFVNVVGRYGFGHSFAVTEELSTFLMIWITYLGAGLALREGRHAAFDLFQDMLPERYRKAFRAALGLVIALFVAVLGFLGIKFVIFGWAKETATLQIPKGIPYMAIPLGALIFIVHMALAFRGWVDRLWAASSGTDSEEREAGGRP